ncbi:antitoxin Xre/MbcA/ParS toxin-binding domain-containing protein [Dongia sp.]|uniref:antitoxin Xre/MbcA/ParS toxin-binding domain-containing protein n=1 Tax=Dongia sp. TaxID=1977262 RepID=UPI0037518CB0
MIELRSTNTAQSRRKAIRKRAAALQGGYSAGDKWLNTPAMALNGRSPNSVLRQPGGIALVEELLGRLEHGVYT